MADMTLKSFDYKLHTINLTGVVDESMFTSLIERIVDIENADNDIINENRPIYDALGIEQNVKLPKITIYLSTLGGYVYEGLSIYDAIKRLQKKYEVDIICTGKVMSMGTAIMMAVDLEHRFATSMTTFMIHEVSSLALGKLEEMKEDVQEAERLNDILSNILINSTKITMKQLKDVHAHKKDWHFDANEALELEMISEIL